MQHAAAFTKPKWADYGDEFDASEWFQDWSGEEGNVVTAFYRFNEYHRHGDYSRDDASADGVMIDHGSFKEYRQRAWLMEAYGDEAVRDLDAQCEAYVTDREERKAMGFV